MKMTKVNQAVGGAGKEEDENRKQRKNKQGKNDKNNKKKKKQGGTASIMTACTGTGGKILKVRLFFALATAGVLVTIFGTSMKLSRTVSQSLSSRANQMKHAFVTGKEKKVTKSPLSDIMAKKMLMGMHGHGHHHENKNKNKNMNKQEELKETTTDTATRSAHVFSCDKYGGPPADVAQEMEYWSDIKSDSLYKSPFLQQREQQHPEQPLYMTFEPDGGGWNNIRMSIETFVTLAIAMGRTLVLPPPKRMYLLGEQKGIDRKKQSKHFSIADFFPMEQAAKENAALHIITMQEFLETVAMDGKLLDKVTGQPSFPPNNRTDWDGSAYDELRFWLRTVTHTPMDWSPYKCLAAFPASGNHKDVQLLQQMQDQIHSTGYIAPENNIGKPVNVSASPMARMRENLASRRSLCVYDEHMQNQLTVHFMCSHKDRVRMLVHFYAFLFMESWQEDLWMKRFVRDYLRYTDEIQCAAARVVNAMRKIARARDPLGNPHGEYDAFHIRRGDFQYPQVKISAEEIIANTRAELKVNSTIFIATDERNKAFFDPLRQLYDIHFLDEFKIDVLGPDVNTNYYGMIDQLVASRGRIFFGAWWSTFTGYIMRLRGYHSVHEQLPGYQEGILPTTYFYVTKAKKFNMHAYAPIMNGFFSREYPTSWRNLDFGIGMDEENK